MVNFFLFLFIFAFIGFVFFGTLAVLKWPILSLPLVAFWIYAIIHDFKENAELEFKNRYLD